MEKNNDISVFRLADVIEPVLARFGRSANDPSIQMDILADMRQALVSEDRDGIRRFLSEDEAYWIGNLQFAYFKHFNATSPLEDYQDWARTKCELLLAVASETREDDGIIQHLLNYEDFHVEVLPFSFGATFIVKLYEMRGLDFFLFHYMGGETSAHEDDALFQHAASVTKALAKLGRPSEAALVEQEIQEKKARLTDIGRNFLGPGYDPSADLITRMRVSGERFWSQYLTPEVWTELEAQSASELVDAFSTEYLLKQGVLSTWSTVVLALCKVIEREASRAIFIPWKEFFQAAEWIPPQADSEKARKRIESRLLTFKMLRSCSSDNGNAPTLGQLVFVARFWNDSTMDRCTDLFKVIRTQVNRISPNFSKRVIDLASALEQPIEIRDETLTISEARNRSAHPREDNDIDWPWFIEGLKKKLGKPPAELLKLVVELAIASKPAQQSAALDADSAALHQRR